VSDTVDVLVPDNEEGTKATVLRWCKAAGEAISKDEPLLELETDKVTVEVPAPLAGELVEILKQPNDEVAPGQVLARIRVAGAAGAAGPRPADAGAPVERVSGAGASGVRHGASRDAPGDEDRANGGRGPADDEERRAHEEGRASGDEGPVNEEGRALVSPAVRRLLAENGLSLSQVPGSGRGGRVTAQDVARHLSAAGARAPTTLAASPSASPPAGAPHKPSAGPLAASGKRVPHTPVRRRVAEHMARSLAAAPHVTTLFEADLGRVQAHRAKHAAEFERQGARLTYTAYFVAACARALMAHPEVNSTFHEDALEMHPHANIGVGTALGNEGLIVPVLHDAETLTLLGIARRLGALVAAARAGKLAPQDVRGGTFTISNHGVGGSLLAAPIVINQPQVAILGVGKVERRPGVIDVPGVGEALAVRTMCYLTLTLDHRALDAFQSNAFLAHVVSTLEGWEES
jgi:2-oxoglutarate dehydrogenase E2 component (dihydrolipoamide succinyltransferase)